MRRWRTGNGSAGAESGVRWSARRQLGAYTILIGGALLFIIPFVWMFTTSLSRKANQGMPRIPRFWPPDPSEFNYMVASTNLPLVQFYLNSLITVTAVTFGYLFFCSLAGYVFAKGRFPGR